MRLRHRPAVARDFTRWMPHSNVRTRYGDLFVRLPRVWASLAARNCAIADIVEDLDSGNAPCPLAIGVSVFLSDEFTRRATSSPLFWIGPELIRRIDLNESPILDLEAIRLANSRGGLNLFCWEVDVCHGPEPEFLATISELASSFFENHAGFKIKEALAQQPFGPVFRAAVQMGGWLIQNGNREYARVDDPDPIERAGEPFVWGMTRELGHVSTGSWLSSLFDYRPPVLFLTPAEQRLLACALREWTDEEIAKGLSVSTSAVKKCWQSIYARVGLRLPALLPDDDDGGKRGTEKKRRLLSYVRSHREELRPLPLRVP
jgi:hypothetical protein